MSDRTSKHTPGPWKPIRAAKPDNVGGYDYAIVTQDRLILAEAYERPSRDVAFPAEANARLIAAAPDLLAALRGILAEVDDRPEDFAFYGNALTAARAAVAGAEGKMGVGVRGDRRLRGQAAGGRQGDPGEPAEGEGERRRIMKKGERFHSAWWEIRDDDDGDGPYWYGYAEGDKDGDRLAKGDALKMDPNHFPVGTRIDVSEPWDEEFYAKLFAERDRRIAGGREDATP